MDVIKDFINSILSLIRDLGASSDIVGMVQNFFENILQK